MGWQDDPVIAAPGTASPQPTTPAPTGGATSTPAPAWMSDPVIPPTAAAAPAADAPQQISHVSSFGPTGNAIANAVIGFDEQARRAATMGLSDKVGALVPAINSAVAKGAGAVGNALGITSPSADATPSPSFSDAYHDELAKERAAGDAYAAAHPIASPIATGLGMLAGGVRPAGVTEAAATNTAANMAALKAGTDAVPMATTAAGLSAAAQAANKTAAMAVPATLAGKVGQGIVGGAEIGGLSGFGQSNDKSFGSDALATAAGAVTGAATGGGTAFLANKVVSPIASWLARSTGSQSVIDNQALNRVAQRISQDKAGGGFGAQDILDAVNAAPAGEKNVIADFGGGNVLGEAGRVVRAPGPGKTVGLNLLADRAKGEPETVANLVQSGISGGGTAYDASQALMDSRTATAKPLYEAAGIPSDPAQYPSAPVVDNPAVTRLLQKSTAVQSAITQAKGLPDYADLPNNSMVLLDKAYKNIGGSAAEATRAGNGESARDLNNLRVQLRNAITGGAADHPYQQALNAYSGPSASLDAINNGRGILTKSPSQISAEVNGLTEGDREFYKLGAADTLTNNAESTGRTGNPAARIAQSVRAQNQLKPLFGGDDTAFNNFVAGIDRANRRMETKTATIGNAATAGRIAEDEGGRAPNPALAGAAEAGAGLATGESIPVASGLYNLFKGLAASGPPRSPAVNASIARTLFNPDPAANQAALTRIMSLQNRPSIVPGATVPLASLAGAHPVTAATLAATPVKAIARRVLGERDD